MTQDAYSFESVESKQYTTQMATRNHPSRQKFHLSSLGKHKGPQNRSSKAGRPQQKSHVFHVISINKPGSTTDRSASIFILLLVSSHIFSSSYDNNLLVSSFLFIAIFVVDMLQLHTNVPLFFFTSRFRRLRRSVCS